MERRFWEGACSMYVDIKGLPSIPIINRVDFSKFTAEKHKEWIRKSSPSNYHQIPGWVVVGIGSNNWSLLLRRTRNGKEEIKEVLDFQTMYSTLNAGVMNQAIIQTLTVFLNGRYPPAIPRAIDH
ncbi:MAG: hypothetical protein Q8R36_04485, partial [bacterium]|nr:hypothetical protein [bacterium]